MARRVHVQIRTTRPLAHPAQQPRGAGIDPSRRLLIYSNRRIFTTFLDFLVRPRQIRWSSDEHIYLAVAHVIQSTHLDSLFPPFCVDVLSTPFRLIANFLIILKQHTRFKKSRSRITSSPTLPRNGFMTCILPRMSFPATPLGPLCARRRRCEVSLSGFSMTF